MTFSRRSLITGLISLVASPAIVRASSLMPVKAVDWTEGFVGLQDWRWRGYEVTLLEPMSPEIEQFLKDRILAAEQIAIQTMLREVASKFTSDSEVRIVINKTLEKL